MNDTHARLIYMANQIARNFATLGEAAAAEATADHITKFWDPRMKQAVLAGDRSALSDTAAAAVEIFWIGQRHAVVTKPTDQAAGTLTPMLVR